MTSGGIIGRVKDIKEVEGDGLKEVRVTVESGTATVVVERSRIVRVGGTAGAGEAQRHEPAAACTCWARRCSGSAAPRCRRWTTRSAA